MRINFRIPKILKKKLKIKKTQKKLKNHLQLINPIQK